MNKTWLSTSLAQAVSLIFSVNSRHGEGLGEGGVEGGGWGGEGWGMGMLEWGRGGQWGGKCCLILQQ